MRHAWLLAILLVLVSRTSVTATTDIVGPAGSGAFGSVTVLPNGNIVVVDTLFDAPGPIADVGAVYLYDGATGALISTLTGSTPSDAIGRQGVTVLTNGNYVVLSSSWDAPGPVADVGAATWGSGTTGVSGVVSAANSLVGSTAGDSVGSVIPGSKAVMALSNGNYVVGIPFWDGPGPVADVGAATWGSGATGVAGAVSAANSLVGSTIDDFVGRSVTALTNGNYVVLSQDWDGPGPVADVGAATWGSGATGVAGAVSAVNSLVGSTIGDFVGRSATALTNGNYVVASFRWAAPGPVLRVGAATWGNGTTGTTGVVSAANSLVGTAVDDRVGEIGVAALTNGNYVVLSRSWDAPGPVVNVGAATWGSGTTGVSGVVSVANSLIGSTINDFVGFGGVTALTNGNYVVGSNLWRAPGPVLDVGAATWGNGTTGTTGVVSAANSLVGTAMGDSVGGSVAALTNGNYVVASPSWSAPGPIVDVGAATWGNGTAGVTGAVSAANSLVGSTASDGVGQVTALTNGNYVVRSDSWDAPGPVVDVGAATWGNGTTGVIGPVSAANSLVGSTGNDGLGNRSVIALTNGNFVVVSPSWTAPGPVSSAGAVTWASGTTGVVGAVSVANSLVGSTGNDALGNGGVFAVTNGNYVVGSPSWDDPGPVANSGAATLGTGCGVGGSPVVGPITASNSILGTAAFGGGSLSFGFDPVHLWLVVGRRADNMVSFGCATVPVELLGFTVE